METKNKKTILVTGGAGFIGSHLIERLVQDPNNRVISLDNYFNGSEDNHIAGAEYVRGETKDVETLCPAVPDIIFHLGEYSRVLTSFEDIPLVWRLNVAGTFAVLEYCRKNGVRLVYAGSSTKFGEFDDVSDGENQTPYAYFKSSNTQLVNNYGTWFGVDYAITYFYNVYGGREVFEGKYATLIGIFKENRRKGLPLTVTAPGTQRRAFTHVDDTVEGLLLVGEQGRGDGYCIGTEKTYSIMDIARMWGGDVVMAPAKKGDRNMSKIHLEKMDSLGWSAKKDVADYIAESVKGF